MSFEDTTTNDKNRAKNLISFVYFGLNVTTQDNFFRTERDEWDVIWGEGG